MLRGIPNRAEETVAPVIHRVAKTRATRDGLNRAGARIDAQIVARDPERADLGVLEHRDLPAIGATGERDPVVEAPKRRVDDGLDVELAKSTEDLFAHVGFVVAIGVLEIPHVRRGRDKETALPASD